jgi:hypothetical protein
MDKNIVYRRSLEPNKKVVIELYFDECLLCHYYILGAELVSSTMNVRIAGGEIVSWIDDNTLDLSKETT